MLTVRIVLAVVWSVGVALASPEPLIGIPLSTASAFCLGLSYGTTSTKRRRTP